MAELFHKILQRLLRNTGQTSAAPPADLQSWEIFLARINAYILEVEQQGYLLERSLDISSKEMQTRWEEMKVLEEQWRSLAECAPDLIYMTDPSGRILFSNRGTRGFAKDDLVGKPLAEIFPAKTAPEVSALLATAAQERRPVSQELHLTSDTWLSLRAAPIPRGTNLAALVVIESDISEARRVAIEVEARKKAEAAAETKSRFLANMSHEIRTPLNGILGLTTVLADQLKNPEDLEKLRLIQLSGQTLLSVVNDILDFSKIEAGKTEIDSQPIDLEHCLESLVELFASKAAEKGLRVTARLEPNVPTWISSDPLKLRQVLLNLIGNALKFTSRGEIAVSVKRQESTATGEMALEFAVKDTGPGISADGMRRLFVPFSQVDGGTTRKYGGTGLGLSISKGLVECLGGRIGVRSELNQGSEFYFVIPVAIAKEKPQATVPASVTAITPLAQQYPLRILLAEDNPVNQMVAMNFLKKLGYTADIAHNGREAVRTALNTRYDLVLMDCHMPEMDGFAATREIHKLVSPPPIVVAVTASTLEEDVVACKQAGMQSVLAKPLVLETLARTLKQIHGQATTAVQPLLQLDGVPLVNPSALHRHFERMQDILIPAVSTYLSSVRTFAARLPTLVETENYPTLEAEARSLQTASTSVSADRMALVCAALVQGCARKDRETVAKAAALAAEIASQLPSIFESLLQDSKRAA